MIVFYTRFNVDEKFDKDALFVHAFSCISGMKNVPASFMNLSWSGDEGREWTEGRNLLSYEVDMDMDIVAFRVAIVDENDELWSTDMVLNEKKHELQFRLAREKRTASAEYDESFNLPYMFKKLFRDGKGGYDEGLPIDAKPIFIDDSNVNIVESIVKGKSVYSLPVIYVSHPFEGDDYSLDIFELAKDMAGSAHVLVEKDSSTSHYLKESTKGKNPYNGAIDVYYSRDSFRYLRWEGITSNQFRYKVSHSIYSRMAMRNIDDECSLSAIRIRNKIKRINSENARTETLSLELVGLREKLKENEELLTFASDELDQYKKKVNELENDIHEKQIKINALEDSLKRKRELGIDKVFLLHSEKEYYDDEIKRFIIKCITDVISGFGDEEQKRRDYHILKDIVDNNGFSEQGDKIKDDLSSILSKDRLITKDINRLKSLGFELQKGGHDKYLFHRDDRYILTVSNSPSDSRNGKNISHEAINLLFGRY